MSLRASQCYGAWQALTQYFLMAKIEHLRQLEQARSVHSLGEHVLALVIS